MTAELNKLIAIIDDDTESTTVAFLAKEEQPALRHAQSFFEAVSGVPNKGFNDPELPDDVQYEENRYSSAVTIYYPKPVALEIIHDWLAENSIKFTADGDDF